MSEEISIVLDHNLPALCLHKGNERIGEIVITMNNSVGVMLYNPNVDQREISANLANILKSLPESSQLQLYQTLSQFCLDKETKITLKHLAAVNYFQDYDRGVKLHLGCGDDIREGWINIDCRQGLKTEIRGNTAVLNYDLRKGLPLNPNMASYIYSSHFFEHLERREIVALLAACFRVLKAGGIIRFALPNMEAVVNAYTERDPEFLALLDRLDLTPNLGEDQIVYADILSWVVHEKGEHKYFIDAERLSIWLKQNGFVDVHQTDFDPTVDINTERRRSLSFYVEARKPAQINAGDERMVIDPMPKISVVMHSYNFSRYLRESIESMLAQTLRPFEIIICDDQSTDDSWAVISEYSRQYPELIKAFRHERNIGMQRNVNFCIMKAQGNLISWLDGDDRWLPRKLELEWKALQRYPDARIAYSNVYTIDAEGNRTGIWYNGNGSVPPSGDVFREVALRRIFPNISSIFRNEMVYRSVYDKVGYFDEDIEIFIDYDFKLRATARYPVVYSGEALVEYRLHDGGIHNSPSEILHRDQLAVYKKNLHLLDSRPEQEAIEIKRQWSDFERYVENAKNTITCNCPYCKETLHISHEGRWQCPSCKNDFSFYSNTTSVNNKTAGDSGGKRLTESNIPECQEKTKT